VLLKAEALSDIVVYCK